MWVIVLIGSLSCKSDLPPTELIQVPIDNLYVIHIPDNLQPGYDMHDYASLQYYNSSEGFYILGIEDAKENLGDIKRKRLKLKGYYAFVENTVSNPVDTLSRESLQYFTNAEGLSVRIGDYYANSQAWNWDPLFYRIAVYESPEYFFQLVMWMPYGPHCERVAVLDSIVYSFKFLTSSTEETAGLR